MDVTPEQKAKVDKQKRDFDDLQNEIAGNDTGRIQRFLVGERSPAAEAKRKKLEKERAWSRLAQMLTDPIYKAKYEGVMSALVAAETETETVLERLAVDIQTARDGLEALESKAARLPDGTRVYRDAQGNVLREDGSAVDDVLAATILWRGDEPSFGDLQAAKAHLAALREAEADARGYRDNVLGLAREQLTDPENPPELDDLEGILGKITSATAAVRPSQTGFDRLTENERPNFAPNLAADLIPQL